MAGVSIAVTQRKGGVGKTTISAHLAAHWAQEGAKVLLIDTDPQGDVSRMLGMKPENGLSKLLVPNDETGETAGFDEVLRPTPLQSYSVPDNPSKGALFVLPSSSATSTITALTDNPFVMAERVQELKELFDVIVIDTAPTISAFDGYVYLASDYYIFVTECEPLSVKGLRDGIAQVKRFIPQRERYGLGGTSRVVAIVPNQVDARLSIHKVILEEIVTEFGPDLVCAPIMYRAKYKEATDFGQLLYAYMPSSGEAKDMRRLSKQIAEAVSRELS